MYKFRRGFNKTRWLNKHLSYLLLKPFLFYKLIIKLKKSIFILSKTIFCILKLSTGLLFFAGPEKYCREYWQRWFKYWYKQSSFCAKLSCMSRLYWQVKVIDIWTLSKGYLVGLLVFISSYCPDLKLLQQHLFQCFCF